MIMHFWLAFIPLFVAVDIVGVLPIFINMTTGLKRKQRDKIIYQSLITALCLALAFILLGKAIFRLLGITMSDFMIAGGSILFCIAVMDLLVPGKKRRVPDDDVGIVPMGTPLIVGPAVLTTSLMLVDQFGIGLTIIAVIVNLVIASWVLLGADVLMKVLGQSGSRAVSKVMALLLAAIAVMMIRKGIWQGFMLH